MLEKHLDTLVVLDGGEGHALGIVSQEDLVQAFEEENAKNLRAEDVMQDSVPQIPPDIPLTAAVKIMRDKGVRALFLMHHAGGIEYPAAVISYRHILRFLAARNDIELRDLGIQAERRTPLEIFVERRDAAKKRV
jgi:predicted transcriptional regulator